jgi:hypothetical protein
MFSVEKISSYLVLQALEINKKSVDIMSTPFFTEYIDEQGKWDVSIHASHECCLFLMQNMYKIVFELLQ